MSHSTTDIYKMKREIINFTKKISSHLPKSKRKFHADMLYGIVASHLVLDNAWYQKCRMVQELACQLDIQLEFIPPYSPNLNLIERV